MAGTGPGDHEVATLCDHRDPTPSHRRTGGGRWRWSSSA